MRLTTSFSFLAGLTLQSAAYATNYTAQLLSSGTVKLGDWEDAYQKAKSFVDTLSDAQKIAIITGSDTSNFTALYQRDSGNSILDFYFVTAWPLSSALAMTWDRDMFYEQYRALGAEFRGKGIQVMKGPVSQPLGRTPWGGRNGESFGPDAYLNGIATGLAVEAAGSEGVISCAKHFLLNEQENNRTVDSTPGGSAGGPGGSTNSSSVPSSSESNSSSMPSTGSSSDSSSTSVAYSAQVDDKTLHETYMWSFYDAVKSGLGAAMCALNRVNLTYACESQDLLAKHLKTEIGFPGLVLGDVGGQKTAFGSANAGMDFGDASTWSNATILAGLQNGSLTEARLDDMAVRNVIAAYYFNQLDGTYPSTAGLEDYVDVRGNHSAIARKIAAASLVLLKNTNNTLPLKRPRTLSIFGAHAGAITAGPNNEISVTGSDDVYQGHAAGLGGSGEQSYAYLATPWYALTTKAMQHGTQFRWIMNNTGYDSSGGLGGYSSGTGASHSYSSFASDTEVCICFLNAYSGEGADRSELTNTDLDEMVTTVASNCNNTIVVINAVAPRLVDAWIENDNVTAVLYGSMLGEQSGNAIVDVLYGDTNPSGKLTYTIAKNESDYGAKLCDTAVCDFSEDNLLDYKYFDRYNVTPRFEFGYGLSYTNFTYGTELSISSNSTLKSGPATGARAVGGREDLWDTVATASIDVTNSGSLAGAEVAQLYVEFPEVAAQPVRQLRGFEKLSLGAGESGAATFALRKRDLMYWTVQEQNWALASGTYTLRVGASSRDLKASATLTVE